MKYLMLVCLVATAWSGGLRAQSAPPTSVKQRPAPATSVAPAPAAREGRRVPARESYGRMLARKRQEQQARVGRVIKEKRREEKLAAKPQYANFENFGHRHPPKKRAPGKKKSCRECGMKH